MLQRLPAWVAPAVLGALLATAGLVLARNAFGPAPEQATVDPAAQAEASPPQPTREARVGTPPQPQIEAAPQPQVTESARTQASPSPQPDPGGTPLAEPTGLRGTPDITASPPPTPIAHPTGLRGAAETAASPPPKPIDQPTGLQGPVEIAAAPQPTPGAQPQQVARGATPPSASINQPRKETVSRDQAGSAPVEPGVQTHANAVGRASSGAPSPSSQPRANAASPRERGAAAPRVSVRPQVLRECVGADHDPRHLWPTTKVLRREPARGSRRIR